MSNPVSSKTGFTRLGILMAVAAALIVVLGGAGALYHFKGRTRITVQDVRSAEKISGLRFSAREQKQLLSDLSSNLSRYEKLRSVPIPNHIAPALIFFPEVPALPYQNPPSKGSFTDESDLSVPENPEDLAFMPVTALAALIKNRKLTSLQLTTLYLERLKRFGPALKCVVTLTEDLALRQAARADEEIAAGKYRGPLHGIPWGAKDLLSTKGIPTTWGAMPFKDQMIDIDATVVRRLDEAGAVLVAKLSMGALAMGDVWFGGKTKNPWNPDQGSSGSSAGPGAATAAGLVGFSIGTETWGSIVSPSTRCGVTGLRPTFGRVSRYGAMALSWSMDKIGPMCRSVEDCALVFAAIQGPDGKDPSVLERPFSWDPAREPGHIRIGYLHEAFKQSPNRENDEAALQVLRSLGSELIPFSLPDFPVDALSFILSAEAAAAFDELTRDNRDDLLVRQGRGAWPNTFRQARFIPAVEYIQANRARTILMQEMSARMKEIDVYVAPTRGGDNLLLTNLTGHPTVVVPNGFDAEGGPTSICFVGNLFAEAEVLTVARAYQEATSFHRKHPDLTALFPEHETREE